MTPAPERKVISRPRERLHPDLEQPRREFDTESLYLLGRSLTRRQHVPLIVRVHPTMPEDDMIVDGERRWRAAGLVGLTHLDVMRLDGSVPAAEVRRIQLQTALQREGLDPWELADGLQQFMKDNNLTKQVELSDELGVKQPAISKVFRIVDDLAPDLRPLVENMTVCPSVAYLVATLPTHDQQREVMRQVVEKRLKRAAVEVICNRLKSKKQGKKPKSVKGRTPAGLQYQAPGSLGWEPFMAEVKKLLAAADLGIKQKLPFCVLPDLLKA